jgi:hypothetical protein
MLRVSTGSRSIQTLTLGENGIDFYSRPNSRRRGGYLPVAATGRMRAKALKGAHLGRA